MTTPPKSAFSGWRMHRKSESSPDSPSLHRRNSSNKNNPSKDLIETTSKITKHMVDYHEMRIGKTQALYLCRKEREILWDRYRIDNLMDK